MVKKQGEKELMLSPNKTKGFTIVTIVIFLLILGYAILRYNIVRGVSWQSVPLYISNKAIAVASVALIAISYLLGSFAKFWPNKFSSKLYLRKHFGLAGFGLAVVHGIVSLLLFNASYYPRFFSEAGKLTFEGELSMLFGVLSLAVFSLVAVSSLSSLEQSIGQKKWLYVQRLGYLALILVGLHVLLMGFKGWLNPAQWNWMPPMSLISFIIVAFVLLIKLFAVLKR